MNKIIDAQGRKPVPHNLAIWFGTFARPVTGSWIVSIVIVWPVSPVLQGALMDAGAGIYLWKKLGDRVEEGEPLYRIHACFQSDYDFATRMADDVSGYQVRAV